MQLATKADKDLVVNIITETFEQNPGVNWLLKKGGNHRKKIRRLAVYAFVKALNRNGVYLSDNQKGVAVCYKFNIRKFSVSEIMYELWFAITSINVTRLPKVLKREAYRNYVRPATGEYLYFWFLGVTSGGEKAVFELRDGIFKTARTMKLPIYLETAIERNKAAYERYGYETYHFWRDEKEDIRFWFMKWEP